VVVVVVVVTGTVVVVVVVVVVVDVVVVDEVLVVAGTVVVVDVDGGEGVLANDVEAHAGRAINAARPSREEAGARMSLTKLAIHRARCRAVHTVIRNDLDTKL